MTNTLQIIEFEFQAHAETLDVNSNDADPKPEINSLTDNLNKISDKISQEIQQEVRRVLPPRTQVEADIRFYEGSFTAIGTVILLFLKPIVMEAGRKALEKSFEEGFTSMIQFAVKRVLLRRLRTIKLINPLEIEIKSTLEDTETESTQTNTPGPTAMKSTTNNFQYLLSLTLINTILLIILVSVFVSVLVKIPTP